LVAGTTKEMLKGYEGIISITDHEYIVYASVLQ